MPVRNASPTTHHVVIAVSGRRIERAALGFRFSEFELDDVGLRVLLPITLLSTDLP
ncbi:hypothetical protein [Mycolicibacterium celeriflavum]|uniref:hypothetical protein n=1 Tax=Mycolicibacterium celeriflavum TaxID=1249101 RepID=UPI0013D89426|nr:hypothetical protein [Mycolicibacterium celeriflavum]MCV7238314.1 hypothetical protein [Mycolicibacterium celeriflavum]